MKKAIVAITTMIVSVFVISAMASHNVRGYYRSNGTYVSPHMSMNPGEARSSGYSYHNNEIVPYGRY